MAMFIKFEENNITYVIPFNSKIKKKSIVQFFKKQFTTFFRYLIHQV